MLTVVRAGQLAVLRRGADAPGRKVEEKLKSCLEQRAVVYRESGN